MNEKDTLLNSTLLHPPPTNGRHVLMTKVDLISQERTHKVSK